MFPIPFFLSSCLYFHLIIATFNSSNSWSAYDAGNTSGLNSKECCGAVFNNRFIYFVPHFDNTVYHGRVLRYDTQGLFNSSNSWSAYDAGNTNGFNTTGYYGAVFNNRFIYFVPYYDGTNYHGRVLRYDTQATFNSSNSWSAYDAGNTSGL